MNQKYLYGASIQGIQSFIFQTNKLKDIAGASELIEYICTQLFEEVCKEVGLESEKDYTPIINAAGNVKCEFESRDALQKVVRVFPKRVMSAAPGVTVSQAVVTSDGTFETAINELEQRLHSQRNKPARSVTIGPMGALRSRTTGLPAVCFESGEYLDESTKKKREKQKVRALTTKFLPEMIGPISDSNIAYDITDITDDSENNWIAVIHADGNGIGKVVQSVGKDRESFMAFSGGLKVATEAAARDAGEVVDLVSGAKFPFRPIVLGGDDVTLIIRGDLAIPFTEAFMDAFEKRTQEQLGTLLRDNKIFEDGKDYLTACAGVAFINASYPFYYGYLLAEDLCSHSKKIAKAESSSDGFLPKSCLMFHKVQDSFVEKYDGIIDRELSIPGEKGKGLLKYGPYFLNERIDGYDTIAELKEYADRVDEEDGIRSGIRRWLSTLHNDREAAKQLLMRLKSVHEQKKQLIEALTNGIEENKKCRAYDVLAYHTIIEQKTKERN